MAEGPLSRPNHYRHDPRKREVVSQAPVSRQSSRAYYHNSTKLYRARPPEWYCRVIRSPEMDALGASSAGSRCVVALSTFPSRTRPDRPHYHYFFSPCSAFRRSLPD